ILPEAAQQPENAFRPQPPEQRPITAAPLDMPLPAPPRPLVAARVEPPTEPAFSSPEPRPRPEPTVQPIAAPPVATSPLPAEPMIPPVATSPSIERDIPLRAAPPQPRPAAPPAPQPASFRDTASAAEILDAARQRVLPQQRIEPEVSAPPVQDMPAAARTAEVVDDAAAQSAAIRRDFQ
ncbi:flagellar biosynthetic protein FliO, partial [Bradyrhizobium sp. Lot11]